MGGLFRIRLHVFGMSFKRQNDVTPSNAMTNVILQWQSTSASALFPHAFKICDFVEDSLYFFEGCNFTQIMK